MRPLRFAAVVITIFAVMGCSLGGSPSPTPTTVDFTMPGEAASMVNQLMETAGTTHVISVVLTSTEVRISVLSSQQVLTYAYRDQQISRVDSDIAYVGQAMFDPRNFNLTTIGDLFDQAFLITGSHQGQQLQIVDYDDGNVVMTVTTNPETRPVFFSPDGVPILPFDPTSAEDLVFHFGEVIGTHTHVVRVGVGQDGSVYADLDAGPGQILHIVRSPRFPVRTQVKSEFVPTQVFDPGVVTVETLDLILSQASELIGRPTSQGFQLTIECQNNEDNPSASITMGSKTIRMTLTGIILTT